jgi:electron transport complex protein RnfG
MNVVKQMFAVLTVVGVMSSLVLAASYKFTKPRIEQHKLEELRRSIFVVVPEAKTYEEIGTAEFKVFKGLNEQSELAGYAFIAQGSGFQGTIRMIVGIAPDLKTLFGMRVLEQVETPGLGAKIAEDTAKKDFFEQFAGLQPDWTVDDAMTESQAAQMIADFLAYVKNLTPDDPNEIQAITGATISSAAVVKIVNQSLAKLEKQLNMKL